MGDNIYIGPGAIFKNQINIGSNVLIGIGSIIIESINDNQKYLNQIRPFKLPMEEKKPYIY